MCGVRSLNKPLLVLCIVGLIAAIPITQATISIENQSVIAGEIPTSIEVSIDVRPNTLHSNSKGRYVTCYVMALEGYSVHDIDVSTILLEGLPVLPDQTGFIDHDLDGVCDLMVKFSRVDLFDILPGFTCEEYPLTLTGSFEDGTVFSGVDTVHIVYQ